MALLCRFCFGGVGGSGVCAVHREGVLSLAFGFFVLLLLPPLVAATATFAREFGCCCSCLQSRLPAATAVGRLLWCSVVVAARCTVLLQLWSRYAYNAVL